MINEALRKKLAKDTHLTIKWDTTKQPGGQRPTSSNSKKVAQVRVEFNDREEALETVKQSLDSMGITYTFSDIAYSSFGCLNIPTAGNYDKVNKVEHTFRILFKFAGGQDFQSMGNKMWTPMIVSNNITKKIPKNKLEAEMLMQINKKITALSKGRRFTLILKSRNGSSSETFNDVVGLVGGDGKGHADFVVKDVNDNSLSFITHKQGNNPRAFQQYAGIQEADKLTSHGEVVDFKKKVVEDWNSGVKHSFEQAIDDVELKKMSVYGVDYGGGWGNNNCNWFAQGGFELKNVTKGNSEVKTLQLSFKHRMVYNGSLTTLKQQYTQTLGATPRSGRRITSSEGVASGIRGGVYSKGFMSRRKPKTVYHKQT